jgi:hypothetical protein
MIKNIFICDRCKKEHESGEQMWTVGAYIESYTYGRREVCKPSEAQLWCRSCCVVTGFVFRAKPEADGSVSPIPEPTLEQKLRQIIEQIAAEVVA